MVAKWLYRVVMRRKSLRQPNMRSMRLRLGKSTAEKLGFRPRLRLGGMVGAAPVVTI